MRGRSVAERIEKEPELQLCFGFPDAQDLEDSRLDVAAMDPDAARAEFPAVEHEVIGLRTDVEPRFALGGIQQVDVVDVGHREGVMSGDRVAVVVD